MDVLWICRPLRAACRLVVAIAVGGALVMAASLPLAEAVQAQATPPPPRVDTWPLCSQQYQWCPFTGTRNVRYGTPTVYVTRQVSGPVHCGNSVFGDPSVGASKSCWLEPLPLPRAELGVYLGAGCTGRDRLPGYEAWLGRKVDRVLDSLASQSWDAMLSTTRWIAGCWQPANRKLTITVPMLPSDGISTIVEGARGAYDAQFRNIAQTLIELGQSQAVVRLGPEFNGAWFRWSALSDPQSWVLYWRSAVTAMRSVPGQRFKFDWCPSLGLGIASPEPAYPGDAYVDYIGGDVYNSNWHQIPQPDLWSVLLNAPAGLKWHANFAMAHGKPMSFPEWGTGTRPDGFGGGDDAYFVRSMAAWIKLNRVLYHNYFDYPASVYNSKLSDGSKPLAAQAYLESFGGPR